MQGSTKSRVALGALLALSLASAHAGDKLLGTWGVTEVEGAAGGGLTPWALVAGSGSRDQIGATASATAVRTQGGYTLSVLGAAVGLYDTVELSAARWRFGLSDTVPGQAIRMDVLGVKWRVLGDAVYDQDRWWPQVAAGAQWKRTRDFAVPAALGAKRDHDVDLYASATKVWLAGVAGRNTLANLTARYTRANQFGLLGFGGDKGDTLEVKLEASLALLVRDDVALGAEWRQKPDNLGVFREQRACDVFVAWFPSRHLSVTAAWVDLGNIANKPHQGGWYLSVQGAL